MNTIVLRINDFLKQFPPFNMLSQDELISLCETIEVHYIEKNNPIFSIEEIIHDRFYVVKDGAIGLFKEDGNILIDQCDEGDIFGLRAVIREGNYVLSAKAIEESIVYSLPANVFKTHFATNLNVSSYLMSSFASNTRNENNSSENESDTIKLQGFTEEQTADYSKNPIQCSPETSIKEAATVMTKSRVGSIVVVKNNKPIGIITDKDLRTKIATGAVPIGVSVTEIMSSPVITYPENITVAEAQIAMLKHRITHLCITKDGSTDSELTGILSEHDIIAIRENSASSLVKEVKRAKTVETLKQIRQRTQFLLERYIQQGIPIAYTSKIISAINDSITKKVITLAIDTMPTKPPVNFAWLMIGSQGREEQLLLTDQDNALVFGDVTESNYDITQNYFLKLSQSVTKSLNTIGFEYCPAEMMASNPKWCLSVSQWKTQFNRWITKPDQDKLMLCTIFFDFEIVFGDNSLVNSLSESIFDSIESYDIFLNYLGLNALQNPPPLSFFRQFLVEQSGEHKDQFDIKGRAMMPLVDAARLLILSHETKSVNNTIERYEKLMQLEPQNKEIYQACAEAFKVLLRFRTEQGLINNDSGRFIDLKSLNKSNRLQLKQCFKSIKEVQELIQVRFKLAQLM